MGCIGEIGIVGIKLLDVCKSGFYHKMNIPVHGSHFIASKVLKPVKELEKLYRVVLRQTPDSQDVLVMQISEPFAKMFPLIQDIIVHAYSLTTVSYIEFNNISKIDLRRIASTHLSSYEIVPFEVEEICFYLNNYTWDVYISIPKRNQHLDAYSLRDRWTGQFQKLFNTEGVNVVLLCSSGEKL